MPGSTKFTDNENTSRPDTSNHHRGVMLSPSEIGARAGASMPEKHSIRRLSG